MSASVRDLSVLLEPRPGALAEFGETLGAAGVSLEGGGVFTFDGVAVAHFLIAERDADAAVAALAAAGVGRATVSDVIALRLDQDRPGQLGAFTRRLGDAGIDILVQYSDHDHRLILVVEPQRHADATRIAAEWGRDLGR